MTRPSPRPKTARFRAIGFEVVRVASPRLRAAAISEAAGQTVLLTSDHIYISEKAARDFVKAAAPPEPADRARPRGQSLGRIHAAASGSGPRDESGRALRFSGRRREAAAPIDDAQAWLREIRQSARRCLVPMREIVVEIPLPVIPAQGGERPVLRYPVTSTVVVSIEHWVHILWLNQIAFGIRWMEHIRRHPLWTLARALSRLSFDRERLLERLVSRGSGVRIHPTAYVSGSILGDGVVVGPHVTIKNSIIGAGTHVQDHAVLLSSVIGARCLITENTFGVSLVSYPEATIGNYKMQVSLIGRGAYVNAWAGFVDAKFVGTVRVMHRGELADSERAFLGSCIGHGAKVAAKVLIQAGREIPNETTVVMRPDEVVSVIPQDLRAGRPMVRDRGTLVPLGEEGRSG